MDNDTFRRELELWIKASGCSELADVVPANSGLFRIANVKITEYQPSFVSTAPGSFKNECVSGNWYAETFGLAEAEVHVAGEQTYEISMLNEPAPVLNMNKLPQNLQQAIYDDRDLPSGSYDKSLIVLSGVQGTADAPQFSGVWSPSRRGMGGVFVYNPAAISSRIVYSGERPPNADEYEKIFEDDDVDD